MTAFSEEERQSHALDEHEDRMGITTPPERVPEHRHECPLCGGVQFHRGTCWEIRPIDIFKNECRVVGCEAKP